VVDGPSAFTGRRKLALGVGGAGVVAVGAGVLLGLQAKSLDDDANALCPSLTGCANADAANQTLQGPRDIMLYNAGAAAIVKGDSVSVLPSDTTYGYLVSIEQTVIADARPDLIAGGALEAIAVGAWGKVRVLGVQEGVNVADAATPFDNIGVGAANGRLADAVSNAVLAPGIILAVVGAGNLGTVRWWNRLAL
jgi:hypothetical protein